MGHRSPGGFHCDSLSVPNERVIRCSGRLRLFPKQIPVGGLLFPRGSLRGNCAHCRILWTSFHPHATPSSAVLALGNAGYLRSRRRCPGCALARASDATRNSISALRFADGGEYFEIFLVITLCFVYPLRETCAEVDRESKTAAGHVVLRQLCALWRCSHSPGPY